MMAEDVKEAVAAAIEDTKGWRVDINTGKERIRQTRRCLDDTSSPASEPKILQIGSSDMVQAFDSRDAKLTTFSSNAEEQAGDELLLHHFLCSKSVGNEEPSFHGAEYQETSQQNPALERNIHRVFTTLQKPGSPDLLVEEMSLPPNTEIREVLGIFRDKVTSILKRAKCVLIFNIGSSSVAGLQIKRTKESAMLGPIILLSASALVSVISDPSCYDLSNGLSINKDETLLTSTTVRLWPGVLHDLS